MKELEEKIVLGDLADVQALVSAWLFAEFTEGLNPTVFVGISFFFQRTNLAATNSFCNSDKEAAASLHFCANEAHSLRHLCSHNILQHTA